LLEFFCTTPPTSLIFGASISLHRPSGGEVAADVGNGAACHAQRDADVWSAAGEEVTAQQRTERDADASAALFHGALDGGVDLPAQQVDLVGVGLHGADAVVRDGGVHEAVVGDFLLGEGLLHGQGDGLGGLLARQGFGQCVDLRAGAAVEHHGDANGDDRADQQQTQ